MILLVQRNKVPHVIDEDEDGHLPISPGREEKSVRAGHTVQELHLEGMPPWVW